MKLYTFFRSSAAFRVRIALNHKGLAYEHVPVSLAKAEHLQPGYGSVNAQKLVPALEDGGRLLAQSLAIIEYLDEIHPEPPLLPADAIERAQVRAFAQIIACDIHPLNNLVALNYLKGPLKHDQAATDDWYRNWVVQGFDALEALIRPGPYAFGAHVTLADICLVPQVFNAQRYKADLKPYPALMKVFEECMKVDAFDRAQPMKQPEAANAA